MSVAAADLDEQLARIFASDPLAMAESDAVWRRLRETAPVFRHEQVLLVTRYEDIRKIHRDGIRVTRRGFFEGTRADAVRSALPPDAQASFDAIAAFQGLQVSRTDGEAHERLRRISHRAFTPRRIGDMAETVTRRRDELLDGLEPGGTCDLVAFAYRLPLLVICDMLGVPDAEEREAIRSWANRIAHHLGSTDATIVRDAHAAILSFRTYIEQIIERHRRDPAGGSELVAALMDAEEDERLTPDELAAMFVILLFAGHETTTNLIAIGVLDLLRHPDEWRRLSDDPSLVENTVEELLRRVTPVQFEQRLVVEEFDVGGVTFPPGQTLFTMLAGANRDPEVFARPEELDIARDDARRHLSFGYGPAFCLGASLARLEARAAFEALAERFPGMRFASDPDGLPFQGNSMLRQLAALPVRL